MENDEKNIDASESSPHITSSYKSNSISRRSALKKLGVMVGGVSLAGFGFFSAEPKAQATLNDMADPHVQQETEHSSEKWIYSSSFCSSCAADAKGSDSSNFWVDTSSESLVYWWS